MSLTVTVAEEAELGAWDEYVRAHPDGSPFLTSAWSRVVESTYGHHPFYLVAKQGSTICGSLPLFLFRSRLFNRVLTTSPYASWGSVCADSEASARLLLDRAIALACELDVNYLELKGLRGYQHPQLCPNTRYVTHRRALADPEIMWSKQLDGRKRRAVRKAQKYFLTCGSGHELLECFYKLMVMTMHRLGTPVHSKAFYRNILSTFGQQANVLVARHRGAPVAGFLLVRHQGTMFHLAGGSDARYQYVRPNDFLMWEALRWAHLRGATTFDFGRSMAGSGTATFKAQWGGTVANLHYQYFLNKSKTIPDVNPANPRYRSAIAIWQRLPLPVTKAFGPQLIKYIP